MVSRKDINILFPSTRRERSKEAQMDQLTWKLQQTGGEGMQRLAGLSHGIYRRREPKIISLLNPSYIWQTDPPLPSKIVVDLSNHIPKPLPAPLGWEIQQQNALVLITDTRQYTFGFDAAQYGMLLALDRDRHKGRGGYDRLELTEPFLVTLKLVCMVIMLSLGIGTSSPACSN
jgi:hypothetical protein